MSEAPDKSSDVDGRVHLAFQSHMLTMPVSAIVPLKGLPEGVAENRKFAQILSSIKAIGMVEAPVVIADSQNPDNYLLLDGHLRLEALKKLGVSDVECLLATD
ncbi:ParB/RepB/Spo0J family partition protein [Aminobacter sp. SR38]|jgi:ParB-like chromosome segregation protein Spo0J|uniref:ParB/RepB/Spo0J family partition protein n=1 Tax=Aminobacter sp. SR38 TaxID=2774562 RepID=UPI001FF04DC7|nr:ParB/RepB/Spo0J family partition protein [Aminobacter sp. SR38]